jgi:hypothetical protein
MSELRGEVQNLHVIVQGPDVAYVGTNYEITVQITMDPDQNWVDSGIKRWVDDMKLVIELPHQDDVPEVDGVQVKIENVGTGDKAFELLIDLTAIIVTATFPTNWALYAALINAGAAISKAALPTYFRAGVSTSVTFSKGGYTDPVSRLTIDLNDVIYSYQMPLTIKIRPFYNGGHGPKPVTVEKT